MIKKRSRRGLKFVLILAAGLVLLCVVGLGLTAVLNHSMPTASEAPGRLGEAEKARLAEFFHLRQSLGNAVWPGWGDAEQPVILYNEETVFLVGLPEPSAGWLTVPDEEAMGGPWTLAQGDDFWGETYYLQPLPDSGETPQAFTVKVGNQWAASLTTKEWMEIALPQEIQAQFPPFVRQVFPYFLIPDLFVGNSNRFISMIAHEAFHAYQGEKAPQRLAAAETAVRQAADYPWTDETHEEAWKTELDLLARAVEAETVEETAVLAAQFLAQRAERRRAGGLTSSLAAYEQQREWLEGLAKYAEMEIWRQAAQTPSYQPVVETALDPDFESYDTFTNRWSQEVAQIRRSVNDEDVRFYYSGMAQAVILDRLMPDWKERILAEGVFLEDLLAEAVAAH